MDDVYTKLAKAVFSKDYFISTVRTTIESIVALFPKELQDLYTPELLDRIMEVYADRYPGYLATQIEVYKAVYTEDQVVTLLDIQLRHPWLHEKITEVNQLTASINQSQNLSMAEEITRISEQYFDELEAESEAMADGKD